MATIKKEINETKYDRAILSNAVKSHANDPYFVKKAEEAKEAVSKMALPGTKKK